MFLSAASLNQNEKEQVCCDLCPLVTNLLCLLTQYEAHGVYPSDQVHGVILKWTQQVLHTVCQGLDPNRTGRINTTVDSTNRSLVLLLSPTWELQ